MSNQTLRSAFQSLLRGTTLRLATSVAVLAVLVGCATPPPAGDKEAMAEWEQNNDPMEPMNRGIHEFNQVVDKAVLKPVAEGYRFAVPSYGRERVHDFLTNLRAPVIFANDLLQGEGGRAVQTAMRFFMNTGLGVGGLFDVAAESGIPHHDEDFGQTLASWGVGEGPYLVLPILGPSNPRDGIGLVAEWASDPFSLYMDNIGQDWAIWTRVGLQAVDKRERYLDSLNEIERSSVDYYAALRTLYRQQRAKAIKNESISAATKGP